MFRKTVSIDPTLLTAKTLKSDAHKAWEAQLLRAVIDKYLLEPSADKLKPGTYTVYAPMSAQSDEYGYINVQLQTTLRPRRKSSDPNTLCIDVEINHVLGAGNFGKVERLGTLNLTHVGVVYSEHHPRVKKKAFIAKILDRNYLLNECDLLQKANTRFKEMYFDERGDANFIEDEFSGTPLQTFIDSGRPHLTPDLALKIIRNILLDLKRLHALHIQHNDIKPANIMINSETGAVRIIDLGLAFDLTKPLFQPAAGGTSGAAAPEAFFQAYPDQRADIYSVGISIARLLGAEGRAALYPNANDVQNHFMQWGREPNAYTQLFQHLPCIFSSQEEQDLRRLINGMMQYDVNQRYTLDRALAELNQIERDYKQRAGGLAAYDLANQVKIQLQNIAKRQASPEYTGDPLFDIQNVIFTALSQLADDPVHIKEFISTLDVAAFRGLASKQTIRDKTTEIVETFVANTSSLLDLSDRLEQASKILPATFALPLREYIGYQLQQADKLLLKATATTEKRQVTLDMLANFNASCERKQAELDSQTQMPFIQKLMRHSQLLQRCDQESETDDVVQLKNRVRAAIQSYMLQTLTTDNIKQGKRASSGRRLQEIEAILTEVEKAAINVGDLHSRIDKAANRINYKRFFFFGSSQLRYNVKHALASVKKPARH